MSGRTRPIVALAGGVGAARFLEGLIHVIPQRQIVIIGNVGDDVDVHGLHVSPDLDIVAYTLAGYVDQKKGWGFRGDTFQCQGMLRKLGCETWFNLGDRDLAVHIFRSQQLGMGWRLSEVTAQIVRRLGLSVQLLPATDEPFETWIQSGNHRMHFEEYMVKRRSAPKVSEVSFRGARKAKPARNVIRSILGARRILISPSNPIVSIGAILAVPGIRGALNQARARIVGISPIIGGRTVKGPADRLMKATGIEASALGVAEYYRGILDALIIDRIDRQLVNPIKKLGIAPIVTNTLMSTLADKIRLAKLALRS